VATVAWGESGQRANATFGARPRVEDAVEADDEDEGGDEPLMSKKWRGRGRGGGKNEREKFERNARKIFSFKVEVLGKLNLKVHCTVQSHSRSLEWMRASEKSGSLGCKGISYLLMVARC